MSAAYADGEMQHIAKVTLPGCGGPNITFSSSCYFRDATIEIEIEGGMKSLIRRQDLLAIARLFPATTEATDPISADAAKTLKDLRSMLGITRHFVD